MGLVVIGNIVKKYEGTDKSVIVPEVQTNPIKEIGASAFSHNRSINEVHLPKSVEILQSSAFSACVNLETINLENVREIGYGSFFGCEKLSIDGLPDSIETIEGTAFYGCRNLKYIKLPNDLCVLGSENTELEKPFDPGTHGVFEGSGLEQVDLTSKVTVIEARAFKNTKIKTITIPENIKVIGEEAFCGCRDLQSVTIMSSDIQICDNAFTGCPLLNEIEFPKGKFEEDNPDFYLRIGITDENGCAVKDRTLMRCDSISDVVKITEGVEVIDEGAFGFLFDPSEIILPDSVKLIKSTRIHRSVKMNIPCDYLKQETELPIKVTTELLIGPWKKLATLKDYACLYLFQSAAQFKKICKPEIDKDPDGACKAFAEALNANSSKYAFNRAAEFALAKREFISDESITALYKKAEDGHFTEVIKSLEPLTKKTAIETKPIDSISDTTPSIKEIESFCEGKYSPYLFKEFLKKKKVPEKYFKKVKYKDSEEYAPAFIVECAVVPYMQQLDEVPKNIGDYRRDFPILNIDQEADKVASILDPKSIEEMLDSMFEKELPSNYQVFVPFGRYGTAEQIEDMISRMNRWKDWHIYSSSGRIAIMVARGAIMLNDSKEAVQFAGKNKLTRYYAQIRDI